MPQRQRYIANREPANTIHIEKNRKKLMQDE